LNGKFEINSSLETKTMKNFFIHILFLMFLAACSTVKPPVERSLRQMPASYAGGQDSVSNSALSRNYFFTDEYLRSLIDSALAGNTDLLNAYQHIEVAKANMIMAKGAMLPTVNAAFNPSIRKFGLYTMDGAGNATTDIKPGKLIPVHLPDFFAGFQAGWEPDIYGKLKNRKQAALARIIATESSKDWLQANLIYLLAFEYYELQANGAQLNIIRQNIGIQSEMLDIVRIQKEAARSNELAINQFEAAILNSKALAKEIEREMLSNELNINMLLSRYPQTIPVDSNWVRQRPQLLQTGLPSQLLQHRPDIKIAERELAASRYNVQAAKKAFYPTININATLGLQAFSPATLFNAQSIAYGLFGGLMAPIFNRSALESEFKTQGALQLQALNNYQQTMITAFGEVQTGMKKLENIQQSVDLKWAEVAVLERAIENARLLYQANRASYLEVLTAQQSLLQARLELVQQQKIQWQETAGLFKSIGGGWQ
jgi:outer membrane protein, multidrug efflux system